jgi:hypothetical protein
MAIRATANEGMLFDRPAASSYPAAENDIY